MNAMKEEAGTRNLYPNIMRKTLLFVRKVGVFLVWPLLLLCGRHIISGSPLKWIDGIQSAPPRFPMPVNQTRVLATPTMEKGRQKRRLQSVAHIRDSFEVTPAVEDLSDADWGPIT